MNISLPGFSKKSRLFGETIRKAYLPCFLLALSYNINSLVDSMLAGALFSATHVASVGIASDISVLFSAVFLIFVMGTCTCYTAALGRGQRRKSREVFTAGIFYIVVTGLISIAAVYFFASPLSRLFGAATEALAEPAADYLRIFICSLPLQAATHLIILLLGVYGYQRDAILINLVSLVSNIGFSVFFTVAFPAHGIASLAFGTLCASLAAFFMALLIAFFRKLPLSLRLRPAGLRWARFWSMFSSGMTASVNMALDAFVAGLINTIIVTSALGAEGLAVFTVVHSFWQLSHVASEGMEYAVIPMTVMSHSCHDKVGVVSCMKTAIVRGIFYTLLWNALILLLSPLLIRIYTSGGGLENAGREILSGVIIVLLLSPFFHVAYLLTSYYDNTGHYIRSLILAVIPDSVIFPVFLWLALPLLGYTAIWLGLGGHAIPLLLGAWLWRIFKGRRFPVPLESILLLDLGDFRALRNYEAALSSSEDYDALSLAVEKFIRSETVASRVAYITALCSDELVHDLAGRSPTPPPIDFRIISEEDMFLILIRSRSAPYDPLAAARSEETFDAIGLRMVQKLAHRIDYTYVYKMNMITIKIAKDLPS